MNKMKFISIPFLLLAFSCQTTDIDDPQNEVEKSKAFDAENFIGDWMYIGKEVIDNSSFESAIGKTNLDNILTTGLRVTDASIFAVDYPFTLENTFAYSVEGNALLIEELRSGEKYAELEITNDSLIMTFNQADQLNMKEYYVKSSFSDEVMDILKTETILKDSLIGTWNRDESSQLNDPAGFEMFPAKFEVLDQTLISKTADGNSILLSELDGTAFGIKFIRGTKGQSIRLYGTDSASDRLFPVVYDKQILTD